jgi:hypothetical protein
MPIVVEQHPLILGNAAQTGGQASDLVHRRVKVQLVPGQAHSRHREVKAAHRRHREGVKAAQSRHREVEAAHSRHREVEAAHSRHRG